MRQLLGRLVREDEGQDLVEYVLLVSLIALAVAAAFPPVTAAIAQVFTNVQTQLGGGGGGGG
jgi:Flp pilus assembly pilin Flp